MKPFAWHRYSKKLAARIDTPRWMGTFQDADTKDRGVRLVTGSDGSEEEGNIITFYWLVDENEGLIVDAKHHTFGQSALVGAAEVACEVVCGKTYDQAGRIGADILDKHVRDQSSIPAFPDETSGHLNLVVTAIHEAAQQCEGMPLPEDYVTPIAPEIEVLEGGYPGFLDMTKIKKINLIEQVLAADVRPYIELDDGGIRVLDLIDREVLVAYEGNCTSCHAATGSTLSYIQHVVQAKVHPDLIVVPDI